MATMRLYGPLSETARPRSSLERSSFCACAVGEAADFAPLPLPELQETATAIKGNNKNANKTRFERIDPPVFQCKLSLNLHISRLIFA